MRAFVIRPFRVQAGIDFDRVERELIHPVLTSLHVEGRTTQEIAQAGNIRADMFELLVTADLVIADISIHNANVYYELGIRHAMRDCVTVLIRARAHDVPFDLRTDRYLEYDSAQPAAQRPALTDAIQQSVVARRQDSPVYLLLPGLQPVDPERLHAVPSDFTEDVREARRNEDRALLAVIGEEAAMFGWGLAGRRLVGRAQFDLRAWPDARATWSSIRQQQPGDIEAELVLATVHQRLGQLGRSSDALRRVLASPDLTPAQRAEALALRARNAKTLWLEEWRSVGAQERRTVALCSPLLEEACKAYDEGFLADQNQWYPGVNALALATVTVLLARELPDCWEERFEDAEEASSALRRLVRSRDVLAASVARSLDAEEARCRWSGRKPDVWLEFTRADLQLLTSNRSTVVAAAYQRARARAAFDDGSESAFAVASAVAQCRVYRDLAILGDNVEAALAGLGTTEEVPPLPAAERRRVIIFSGHRIDEPGRGTPRFPTSGEAAARRLIREAVDAERREAGDGPVQGIAGGASGGDILFHEVCAELGVPTTLGLALPPRAFAAASVAPAGPEWMERFARLCDRVPPRVLSEGPELPNWLAQRRDYSVWERNNRWLLHMALSLVDSDITLVVLWDGVAGDGLGGTQDMVRLAQECGVKVVHIDTAQFLPGAVAP